MRIAWFSPLPPVRSGIADCSAELVAALRRRGHGIDAYPAASAHDFPWIHRQRPYDLIVYQFGNSSHHDYQWSYALRYPGLAVLHDACLHHARAAFLLRERRADDYRAEFAWSHPHVSRDAAELAVAGLDSRLFYEWPLVKGLVEASRMVVAHGSAVRSGPPASTALSSIRLGHGEFVPSERRRDARSRIRARYAIAENAVLFGLFGGLTPEKRIPQVLGAMRALVRHAPSARLLLAGPAAAHFDVASAIDAPDLRDRVILTGYLPDDELTDHLAACDVSLNLRWPTAREISGVWLRALAAGVPTIVTDLVHLGGLPSLDPRTWTRNQEAGGWKLEVGKNTAQPPASNPQPPASNPQPPASNPQPPASSPQPPVAIAIDILDEDHSLRVAMRRLALDADLRAQLGRDGQAWWQREHSLDAMVADYERIMPEAAARPDPQVTLPPHMRDDGDRTLRTLLAPFGPGARSAIRQFGGQVSES